MNQYFRMLLLVALFGASITVRAQLSPNIYENLVADSARRIAVAHQVALAKWDSGGAVEDSAREEQVIRNAVATGQSKGLSEVLLTSFFRAQIEANKLVQYSLLSDWRLAGKAPEHQTVNLFTEVRPELDRIQSALISDLVQSADARSQPGCAKAVAVAVHRYTIPRSSPESALDALAVNRSLGTACGH